MQKTASELPKISVIIPVYNEEKRLADCLASIRCQSYPQELIELLIVDDNSTDRTKEIANKYNVQILINGERNIERGKSIGLERAKNELIFLIDADNRIPHKEWLKKLVYCLLENPDAVAAEAIWFSYNKKHNLADRYSELFGVNDPFAFYLNRRDRLMATESKWTLPGRIVKETNNYFLVEFTKENLLTVGSQGFLTKKNLLLKTKWQPYLFHMDSNMDLVGNGCNKYVMVKDSIIHLHSETIFQFLRKLYRNFVLFLQQEKLRRYTWRTNPIKIFLTTLTMVTFIIPLKDSLKGFLKKPDIAWFLHPVFCFVVTIMYAYLTIKYSGFGKIVKV